MLSPGLTVVISPLISLIEDQVAAAQEHGIQAAFLTGGIDATLRKEIYAGLCVLWVEEKSQFFFAHSER